MPLTVGTARYTRRASGLLVRDGFDRANSTTTLGRAETGQAWAVGDLGDAATLPTLGISSNQAFCQATGSGTDPHAWVDAGESDVLITARLTVATAASSAVVGILVRRLDANNYFVVQLNNSADNVTIRRVLAGVGTTPGSTALTLADSQVVRVRVEAVGSSIRVYCDGVFKVGITDANMRQATRFGIRLQAAGNARADEYQIARAA